MEPTDQSKTPLVLQLRWDEVSENDLDSLNLKKFILPSSIFELNREIDKQYRDLPWPPALNKMTVFTEVTGGRGDISAAAKVISLIQKTNPFIHFSWILQSSCYEPKEYLNCPDPSKVEIITNSDVKLKETDLLLLGPVKCTWGTDYIKDKFSIQLNGPRVNFLENAKEPSNESALLYANCETVREKTSQSKEELYRTVHQRFFPSKDIEIPMGIKKGTGILLDNSRMQSHLSRKICCPKYLNQIQDLKLRNDILNSLGVKDKEGFPDYDHFSLNFGYAHKPLSWSKFIVFVAIHEQSKDVTIVLNQKGEFNHLNTETFKSLIFTTERIAFLEQIGYGNIKLKGEEDPTHVILKSKQANQRTLTVIIRDSFSVSDVKNLQLASERILATGDNSAAEAFASRCKLYLYEDIANGGCKKEFLKQQIEVARNINPDLVRLLEIGANNKVLSDEDLKNVIDILHNPKISEATQKYCQTIIEKNSFDEVFEGTLKRSAWHYYIPELQNIEADLMSDKVKEGIMRWLNDFNSQEEIKVNDLSLLSQGINSLVQNYLSKEGVLA